VQLAVQLEDASVARTYIWEQIVGPRVPYVLGSDQASLRFIPQQARVHGFRVRAILPDGRITEATRYVNIDVGSAHVPRAELAGVRIVNVPHGDPIQMNGSASRDIDPGGLLHDNPQMLYYWEQLDGPPIPLSQALSATPYFTPPMVGRYTFRLRVDNQRDGTMSAPTEPFRADVILTGTGGGNPLSPQGSNNNKNINSVSKGGCQMSPWVEPAQDTSGLVLLVLPLLLAVCLKRSELKVDERPASANSQ
jgi:hypothetical protein